MCLGPFRERAESTVLHMLYCTVSLLALWFDPLGSVDGNKPFVQ